MTAQNKIILDKKQISRALARIAHEILERNSEAESIAVIGILTRGAFLAQRVADLIEKLEGIEVPVGLMDISLYRDDVHSKLDQPIIQRTDILFPVKDKNIIVVDDVLFTGRTIRAALNHIVDFGRPRTIQLAVLVDRGHRELPIKADYVGVNIPTSRWFSRCPRRTGPTGSMSCRGLTIRRPSRVRATSPALTRRFEGKELSARPPGRETGNEPSFVTTPAWA